MVSVLYMYSNNHKHDSTHKYSYEVGALLKNKYTIEPAVNSMSRANKLVAVTTSYITVEPAINTTSLEQTN